MNFEQYKSLDNGQGYFIQQDDAQDFRPILLRYGNAVATFGNTPTIMPLDSDGLAIIVVPMHDKTEVFSQEQVDAHD